MRTVFSRPRRVALGTMIVVAGALAPRPAAQEKRAFADYFTFLHSRTGTNSSSAWQLYDFASGAGDPHFYPQVRWSGDAYVTADRKELSGSYYPLIGPYETFDPDIVEYHTLTALAAGFDGFVFEWVMTGEPQFAACDQDLSAMIASEAIHRFALLGESFGFEAGLNWTCSLEKNYANCYPGAPRSTFLDQAAWDLDYMLDRVYPMTGIHVDDRPVVLLFQTNSAGSGGPGFHPADLLYLRSSPYLAPHDPIFLARSNGPLDVNMLPEADGFFGWKHGFSDDDFYSPWTQTTSVPDEVSFLTGFDAECSAITPPIPYMLSAIARFDDHKGMAWGEGEKRYTPFQDPAGETLPATLATWQAAGSDLAFVVTWNDVEESTAIEPTREFDFRNLEACLEGISAWKGSPAPDADAHALLRLPERLHRVRKSIELVQSAINIAVARSTATPSQTLLDHVDAAAIAGYAAADEIADGDIAASATLEIAEGEVAAALASLSAERIDVTWQYDDVGNPGVQSCSPITVWPEPPLSGKQGAKLQNGSQLVLDVKGAPGAALYTGAFDGRATVEFIETNDGNPLHRDWLWVMGDVPAGEPNFSLTRLSKESGGWREVQFDLVNCQWKNACGTGADLKFVTFNTLAGTPTTTAIRRVRIEGFVYRVP